MSMVGRVLVAIIAAGLLPVAGALGDVAGPDESINQAFGPLVTAAPIKGATQIIKRSVHLVRS